MSSKKTFNDLINDTKSYTYDRYNDTKGWFKSELEALKHMFSKQVPWIVPTFFILYISSIIVLIALCITVIVKFSKLKSCNILKGISNLQNINSALSKKVNESNNNSNTNSNNSNSNTNSNKETMSPAQRLHLAHAYSKIGSEYNNKSKYDTALKNPTNGRRKIKGSIKLYDNVEKAGNPMNVARGGVPMNYEKKSMQGKSNNMQALDNATLNGNYGPASDPIGGKSDIVKVGNSTRMAGVNQDLSAFVGITSAKH